MEQYSSLLYSIPYVSLMMVYVGLAYYWHVSSQEKQNIIIVICAVIYMFFFGFRGWIFDDWVNYYPRFEDSSFDSIVNIKHTLDDTLFEPGFMILMILCKMIFPYYEFFVFVCCLINCLLLVRFFKKYVSNVPLAFVFFLCMGGIVIQANLMRNSLALLIFINSLTLIENRRFLPYLGICLLCMTFHLSSLFFTR